MGTCCYSPKRSEFLWWYWLLLASVVGVPMFLACRYVERRAATEHETVELGRPASRVFWASALLSLAAVVLVALVLFPFFLGMLSLPVLTVVFAVCMLPAHCWGSFSDRPTMRIAWRFLAALVLSAFLYSMVLRFDIAASLRTYRLYRSGLPSPADVQGSLRRK